MNIANLSATFASAPSGPPRGGGPFEDVSSLFGMSANDVAERVRSGSSLENVADQLGVAREDLYSALASGAPPHIRESGNLDATVAGIAAHEGPGPMPGGPGRRPGPDGPGGGRGVAGQSGVIGGSLTDAQDTTLGLLSGLVDISKEDLINELQSGTDLAALLQGNNVNMQELASALQSGFLFDARA